MDTNMRPTGLETLMPTQATKADVAGLRLSVKADFADLRADLRKIDASIKTWMIATIISLFFGFAGLFFTLSDSLRAAPAMAPSATVIIQVFSQAAPPSAPPITTPAQK